MGYFLYMYLYMYKRLICIGKDFMCLIILAHQKHLKWTSALEERRYYIILPATCIHVHVHMYMNLHVIYMCIHVNIAYMYMYKIVYTE